MSYLVFLIAVFLSAIAAYYSVMGMIAIFSAAAFPVALMAGGLEAAKLITASWLYRNWKIAPRFLKYYLSIAVVILMFITSMGIFGFLSQAHLSQAVPTGEVVAKVAIYDEKIKTSRENIDANRKALRQMDEAVDQVLSRSADEKGADKAVAIRKGQAKERSRLQAEIYAEQVIVGKLNEERAPIAAEVRKVEAEVGPLKYIAKLMYGDNPDANILEKAVTWVIMVLIFVFDPLAVLLLIAANISFTKNYMPTEPTPSRWSILLDKIRNARPKWPSKNTPSVTGATIAPEPVLEKDVIQIASIKPATRVKKKRLPVTPIKKTESPKKRKPAKVIPVKAEVKEEQGKLVAPLNRKKKIVADDAIILSDKIKVESITTDLEELYKDIVTELTPKKTKPKLRGWFPETKK